MSAKDLAGAAIRDGGSTFWITTAEKADALRMSLLGDGKEIALYLPGNHQAQSRHEPHRPPVTESVVISLGPKCHVTCLNSTSGEKKWSLIWSSHGTVVPEWYAGQNPLIDNGRAILAPGGTALLPRWMWKPAERFGSHPIPTGGR